MWLETDEQSLKGTALLAITAGITEPTRMPGVAALLCGRLWLGSCGAPAVKDPQRVADPSTLRRWLRSLDSSQPPFSFLRPTMHAVSQALDGGKIGLGTILLILLIAYMLGLFR